MLSVAITDLIPDAIIRDQKNGALFVLAGFLLVHLTQHALTGHFHFGEETHTVSPHVSASAIAGLLLHTFGDGVAIASGLSRQPAARPCSSSPARSFCTSFLEGLAHFVARARRRWNARRRARRPLRAARCGDDRRCAAHRLIRSACALRARTVRRCHAVRGRVESDSRILRKTGWLHNAAFFGGVGGYFLYEGSDMDDNSGDSGRGKTSDERDGSCGFT